ncbi:ABC transporter permease [Demequina sp. SYSU T00192]|uniref:ABC transporter permease n=1 Tax=Demequina litoralis TaxID=3051660 RepID=A0ABT8G921_9MICO|nr:ABC transporter permease [Demequina sp. SYSU T00192]MDN4475637.1 ABC transporter permease [Demequina sp. SYSU T00192]
MLMYVVRRLLQAVPVVIGTTFLIYFMVFAMPGDPILAMFGDKTPNQATYDALAAQYHLDQPFLVQYGLYMKDLFSGNLGTTFSGQSVGEVLARTFPVTLKLAAMAIALEFSLAVILGLFAGLRKGKLFDNVTLVIGLVMLSVPIFVLGFLAQYFVAIKWGWASPTVGSDTSIANMWLPAVVLALSLFTTSMRLMRGTVIDTRSRDFVRTAYAKGLPGRRVIPVHVLRNSLIPVVTNSAANFGVLMVGATVTEGIFNVPGVGNTLYQAIIRGEGPTVVSFVTVMVLAYVVINILVDLLYAVLDPRIRYA